VRKAQLPSGREKAREANAGRTAGLAAEAFEGTITDLYLPKKK
jgi:hypothetical protein